MTVMADKPVSGRRVLVMAAVEAEREAIRRGIGDSSRIDVRIAGVGPVAAAASTAKILATERYDLVISAGIGGGFAGRAEVGSLVVADRMVAADLGAETPEGFLSLDELGFGSSACVQADGELSELLTDALIAAGLPALLGPVLTVCTVTGTEATASELAKRVPGAAAEAMEGYGVAIAAKEYGLPVLEVRAVSNPVGPRDRASWKIKEALQVLETASQIFPEVL